jgi:hypothetical protein
LGGRVVFFSWESRCVGVLHAPDVRARGNIVGATGRAGGHGWALGTRWAVAGVRRRRRQAAEQGGLGEGARTGLRGCGCLGHERGGRESACGPREHAGRGAGRGKRGAPGATHGGHAKGGSGVGLGRRMGRQGKGRGLGLFISHFSIFSLFYFLLFQFEFFTKCMLHKFTHQTK